MVYLRIKKGNDAKYVYLVKSVWDRQKRTSRQEIIKYLGKLELLSKDDLPPEYRDKIDISKMLDTQGDDPDNYTDKLYNALTSGDLDGSMAIYNKAIVQWRKFDVFFERALRPVLYNIGQRWADGGLDIATEHIASNTVQSMIKIIQGRMRRKPNNISVMLCMPVGEEHKIPCDILETFLTSKGYTVYNMGSLPATDLLGYIYRNRPDIVFITASLHDSVKPARNLSIKITEQFKIPNILGGYAFSEYMDLSLSKVPAIIKCALESANEGKECIYNECCPEFIKNLNTIEKVVEHPRNIKTSTS